MHVLIINGSPRVKQYSNTDKILEKITAGLSETGCTFEQYEVSDRKQWDRIREAFDKNENILIALPLYVECIPGLLMEFLETVTPKTDGSKLAFILQSGFAEGIQLRCGEEYLEKPIYPSDVDFVTHSIDGVHLDIGSAQIGIEIEAPPINARIRNPKLILVSDKETE